jgi:hypothetical protein
MRQATALIQVHNAYYIFKVLTGILISKAANADKNIYYTSAMMHT